ncbi:MAG TPA: hypothetical protein VFY71_03525 [Planctomycetota bacterium]|nr:hypothetical protein [Planctomycetota bacterium]
MGRWLALGALLLGALCAHAAAPAQEDEAAAMARKVFEALKAGDTAALGALVDFDQRSADRVARYQQQDRWADMDEAARADMQLNLLLDWTEPLQDFNRRATIISLEPVADPDAGQGPVPQRRILKIVARNPFSGQVCDILVVLNPGLRLLDVVQGDPYRAGENPAGLDGLQPRAYFTAGPPDESSWPKNLPDDELDHIDASALVDSLLGAKPGTSIADARQQLHAHPNPSVALLVERLGQMDAQPEPDAAQQALLVAVLEQITGHKTPWLPAKPPGLDDATWRARNHDMVRDWCRWYAAQGWHFVVQPPPTAAQLAAAPVPTAPPAGRAPPPKPPGSTRPAGSSTPPVVAARPSSRDLLLPAAAELTLRFQGRQVTGREVEPALAPALKEALNDWAETCTKLQLTVVSTGKPDFLVIGRAQDATLDSAANWMDEALALLDPVVPVIEPRQPKTVVAVFFDLPASRTPFWGSLLDELVRRRLLLETTAGELRSAPAGLLRRQAPLFLQPTWDLGEDSADGGGEFQLGNEVAGKFAQCLVTTRCGELPRPVLWGLDYVVEMQLFTTVYQFDSEGFMATADHFDWPVRTKQMLAKAMKARDFSLGALAAKDASAGKPEDAQMIIWAALEWMRRQQPAALAKLLKDLAALQTATGPRYATSWTPAPDATAQAMAATLDAVDAKALHAWLDAM